MPPPVTANLLAHYDASELGLANGAAVDEWPDLSGNGFNLIDIGTLPAVVDPALNGLPGVYFGPTDRLRATGVTSHTNATIFLVAVNPSNGIGIAHFNDQLTRKPFFAKWSQNGRWVWGISDTNGSFIEFTDGALIEQPCLWTGTIEETGAVLRANQVERVSGNLAGVGATTGIEIGNSAQGDWLVCEYLYYRQIMSAGDRDLVEDYLFEKWFVAPAPPDAPANPSATAQSTTSILVEWDNVDDETGFRVERSLDGSTGWVEAGELAADDLDFLDTGRTCGVEYFYRVFAFNDEGDSDPSAVVSATTLDCPPPPAGGGNRMGGDGAIRHSPPS